MEKELKKGLSSEVYDEEDVKIAESEQDEDNEEEKPEKKKVNLRIAKLYLLQAYLSPKDTKEQVLEKEKAIKDGKNVKIKDVDKIGLMLINADGKTSPIEMLHPVTGMPITVCDGFLNYVGVDTKDIRIISCWINDPPAHMYDLLSAKIGTPVYCRVYGKGTFVSVDHVLCSSDEIAMIKALYGEE